MSVYNGTNGFHRKATALDVYRSWTSRELQGKRSPGIYLTFPFSMAPTTCNCHGAQKGSVEMAGAMLGLKGHGGTEKPACFQFPLCSQCRLRWTQVSHRTWSEMDPDILQNVGLRWTLNMYDMDEDAIVWLSLWCFRDQQTTAKSDCCGKVASSLRHFLNQLLYMRCYSKFCFRSKPHLKQITTFCSTLPPSPSAWASLEMIAWQEKPFKSECCSVRSSPLWKPGSPFRSQEINPQVSSNGRHPVGLVGDPLEN
ncbi:uncharacterized protein Gm29958 [Mus musculus]|uniref:uncharacterized protein Gm29958 n=1 Tax=Mus musculus TaxID=10090 RepID=UPI0003D744E0|nr:uncharacterized protein Gm29958 [Mus musculus]|eukprot:XP_006534661.1 PREDICTED: uncharacterized protein Gm29958 [Mus musculus]